MKGSHQVVFMLPFLLNKVILKTSPLHCFFSEGKQAPQELVCTVNVHLYLCHSAGKYAWNINVSSFIFPFLWQVQNKEDLYFVIPLFRIKQNR